MNDITYVLLAYIYSERNDAAVFLQICDKKM